MNIFVQNTGGDASSLNGKRKFQIRHLLILQEIFYLTKVTKNTFGDFTISIPSSSPAELRIYCVVMFLTFSGMEQDFYTNTSKYGV